MAYHGGGFGGGMNMNALMQQAKRIYLKIKKADQLC